MERTARCVWVEGLRFDTYSHNGKLVRMDGWKDHELPEAGPTPGELIPMALGTCTGMDVVFIAGKQRMEITGLEVEVVGHGTYLTRENALDILSSYDVIVDASDNFPTRYLASDACVILKKPLVYGALHGYEGQVSVFNYQGGPTYRCLFPNMPAEGEVPNCNEHGVLGISPGIIGNLQALEVVKVLTGLGKVLSGEILIFNGLDQSYQKIRFEAKKAHHGRTLLEDDYGWEAFCEVLPSISANDLRALLLSSKKIQLIDVRTREELEQHRVADSMHIPLDQLPDRATEIDFNLPVYLLCKSGQRSATALKLLRQHRTGAELYNVEGGIQQLLALAD